MVLELSYPNDCNIFLRVSTSRSEPHLNAILEKVFPEELVKKLQRTPKGGETNYLITERKNCYRNRIKETLIVDGKVTPGNIETNYEKTGRRTLDKRRYFK